MRILAAIVLSAVTIWAQSVPTATSFQFPLPSWQEHTPPGESFGFGDLNRGVGHHLAQDTKVGFTPTGTKVFAAADGIVRISDNSVRRRQATFSGYGNYWGLGYVVVIEHKLPDGSFVTSLYGHVQSGPFSLENQIGLVPEGTPVKKGQYIAAVADYWDDTNENKKKDFSTLAGDENWHHLHFGIRKGPFSSSSAAEDSKYVTGYDDNQWIQKYTEHVQWENPNLFVSARLNEKFTESFTNAPDITNNWTVQYNHSGEITYTQGNLRLQASRTPYPPGGSVLLVSKQVLSGDVDVSFELNHQGYGQTKVGLFDVFGTPLVFFDLDTDDVACLWMNVPGQNSAVPSCPSGQYMNRWTTLRIQLRGTSVKFYADGNLLKAVSYPNPTGYYRIGFGVGSAPWKSSANDTSFRSINAYGILVGTIALEQTIGGGESYTLAGPWHVDRASPSFPFKTPTDGIISSIHVKLRVEAWAKEDHPLAHINAGIACRDRVTQGAKAVFSDNAYQYSEIADTNIGAYTNAVFTFTGACDLSREWLEDLGISEPNLNVEGYIRWSISQTDTVPGAIIWPNPAPVNGDPVIVIITR